jgi:phage shock protein C
MFGVCGGLGEHFGVDPVIIRILFVAFALASLGFALLVYLLLAVLVPEEPLTFAV